MADKQIIIDGCEFQSDCIEYKDISYLKIMPICAIHELSIACHDKVNKCKYYKLYKQLKRKEQECEELKEANNTLTVTRDKLLDDLWIEEESLKDYIEHYNKAVDELDQLKQTLAEIKEIAEWHTTSADSEDVQEDMKQILQKISEVENE